MLEHSKQKIKLSDTDKNLLYRVADATTEDKATKAMHEVRETVPRAFLYLEAIPGGMQHWSTWAINQAGFATYVVKTSNGAEQKNAWLGVLLRASNPVSDLYGYMTKLMWKFKKRYDQVVGRRPGGLVEAAKRHLNQQLKRSREYIAFELNKGVRDVRHIGMFTVRHCEVAATKFTHRVHIVDVPERTCTCGYWQDSLLPCCRALAATKTHMLSAIHTKVWRVQRRWRVNHPSYVPSVLTCYHVVLGTTTVLMPGARLLRSSIERRRQRQQLTLQWPNMIDDPTVESGREPRNLYAVDVLTAMRWSVSAVTSTTIRNCWAHTGVLPRNLGHSLQLLLTVNDQQIATLQS
ncbi:hypothetical protein H257_17019 [Aphanomyces astaci]|uniref:SWIM-type domain-containing protein n=1 Tax=Aphanomyces astaci TaxID=112090 RepID=W4FID4_APHAT|nr:hypothetical protein H257_17019 [Aphanomyces astaci]ETV66589.1 hypothetical protein H257_17019 [Aphanomyces astaci]|eukprot:XP_009843960.1 hypothetical protein H257_17019 [Aphanomyces astaci]